MVFKKKVLQTTNYKLQTKRGFTMIELLLVVAIMGIVAGLSAPVYQSFQVKNDLDVAVISISQQIRRAQSLSISGTEDSSWGIEFEIGKVIIFKGNNFALRDASFDEILEISKSISINGEQEIIFSKIHGIPNFSGNITLTSINNDSRDISINSKGVVEY